MPEPYPIPTQETQIELVVVNSRFIATALLADTVVSARESLARIRADMLEANHYAAKQSEAPVWSDKEIEDIKQAIEGLS